MSKLVEIEVLYALMQRLPANTRDWGPSYKMNIWGDLSFPPGHRAAVPPDKPIDDTVTFYKIEHRDDKGPYYRWALKVED